MIFIAYQGYRHTAPPLVHLHDLPGVFQSWFYLSRIPFSLVSPAHNCGLQPEITDKWVSYNEITGHHFEITHTYTAANACLTVYLIAKS